jgi:hypothetical protein
VAVDITEPGWYGARLGDWGMDAQACDGLSDTEQATPPGP